MQLREAHVPLLLLARGDLNQRQRPRSVHATGGRHLRLGRWRSASGRGVGAVGGGSPHGRAGRHWCRRFRRIRLQRGEAESLARSWSSLQNVHRARHGTRSPTKKRIQELDRLADDLELLLQKAKIEADNYNLSLQNFPEWLQGWRSPWKGKQRGGELVMKGEDELYDMARRVREGFPELFQEDYHSDVFVIKSTQVPRASASAVAFGIGLFHGRGTLGPGRQHAFSITTESRESDVLLRFFDSCQSYKVYRKHQDPAVDKLKEPILDEITSALRGRHHLNFTRQETSSLWFLCKQEASLLGITDQACGLFNHSEVALLEWTDDLELFILKGYGNALNYRMGVPLLEDVLQSMEDAMEAREGLAPGSYEKARLRFAHAETVVPFSCLLGLFLDGSEFEKKLKEQPVPLPPKPPRKIKWRGSFVAPFAGNTMLVLHHCSSNMSSNYYVQVQHNEYPVQMPGCHNSDVCPFEVFKDKVVAPHQKHDYHRVCSVDMNSAGPFRSPRFEQAV